LTTFVTRKKLELYITSLLLVHFTVIFTRILNMAHFSDITSLFRNLKYKIFTAHRHSLLMQSVVGLLATISVSVRLSVTRWNCVKMTEASILRSSLMDSPMTLGSSRLTSPRTFIHVWLHQFVACYR